MQRCTKCQNLMEKSVKPEHIEDLGGLGVKVLNAVVVHRCASCSDELMAIPDPQGLARAAAIARALNPTRLSGMEIRFIRRALEMTQKDFAEAMELSHVHVSRWENGHRGVGAAGEKLIRHNICALLEGAIDYDPKAIAKMQFREYRPLPPIEMVRVRISRGVGDDKGTWSVAAA